MNPKSVDPKKLKFLEYNPAVRITDKATKELFLSMKKDGFWSYRPILITKDYVIADGHRRTTCALKLGIPLIPAFVVDKNASEIWMNITKGDRAIKSKDVFEVLSNGMPPKYIPDTNVGRAARRVINNYGQKMVDYAAKHGVSSSVFPQAKNVAIYLGHEGDTEYVEKIIYWLIDFNYIHYIRAVIDMRMSPEKISLAVENGVALSL